MMDMPINYVWEQPIAARSNPPASVTLLVMPAATSLEIADAANA
jgi:hypothetical protein